MELLPNDMRYEICSHLTVIELIELSQKKIPILSLCSAITLRTQKHRLINYLRRRTLPSLYDFGKRFPLYRRLIMKIIDGIKEDDAQFLLTNPNSKQFLMDHPIPEIAVNYPQLPWNNSLLSVRVTEEQLLQISRENPAFVWKSWELTHNPRLSLKFIQEQPEFPWNKTVVSRLQIRELSLATSLNEFFGPTLTDSQQSPLNFQRIEDYLRNSGNWSEVTVEMMTNYPVFSWIPGQCSNPNSSFFKRLTEVQLETVRLEVLEYYSDWSIFDMDAVSSNRNLTIEFVRRNLNKSWSWRKLLDNKAFSNEDVLNNFDLPWSFHLTKRKCNMALARAFLTKMPDIDRRDCQITFHIVDMTEEFFNEFKHRIHLNGSIDPMFSFQIIANHPEQNWHMVFVSVHATIKDIRRYPTIKWSVDHYSVCVNPDFELYPDVKFGNTVSKNPYLNTIQAAEHSIIRGPENLGSYFVKCSNLIQKMKIEWSE